MTKLERLKVVGAYAFEFKEWITSKASPLGDMECLNELEISSCSIRVFRYLIDLPYVTVLKVDNLPLPFQTFFGWETKPIQDITECLQSYKTVESKNRPDLFSNLNTFVLTDFHMNDSLMNSITTYPGEDIINLVTVLIEMFPNLKNIDLSRGLALGTVSFGYKLATRIDRMVSNVTIHRLIPSHVSLSAEDYVYYEAPSGERFPKEQLALWPQGIHRILRFREQLALASAPRLTLPANSIWDHTFVYHIIRNDLQANIESQFDLPIDQNKF